MLKRKEEIRRRLTIAEVPKPPVDLVQKIKRDIPKHYTSKPKNGEERRSSLPEPIWNFWGFSWQLAAGILVLIGMTWAVFETWQGEQVDATQIAEAAAAPDNDAAETFSPDPALVEEKEEEALDRTKNAPEVELRRAEAPQAVATDRLRSSVTERQDAPAPAAPPPPAAKMAFAEPPAASAPPGRTQASKPSEAKVGDSRVESVVREEIAQVAPTSSGEASGAKSVGLLQEGAGLERDAAKEQNEATRSVAGTFADEVPADDWESDSVRKIVIVDDLDRALTVQVELDLDVSGKVTSLKVKDVDDKKVIRAVEKASADWSFPNKKGKDDLGKRATRTIEVDLKPKH